MRSARPTSASRSGRRRRRRPKAAEQAAAAKKAQQELLEMDLTFMEAAAAVPALIAAMVAVHL